MPKPKLTIDKDGNELHYSAGALIKKDNKYLLIDRAQIPYGLAGPAGHVDEEENEMDTVIREVFEETGLTVTKCTFLCEELHPNNICTKGVKQHFWYVFECEVSGELNRDKRETKSIGWYTIEEIKKGNLEPVWGHWFKKLKII